MDELKEKLAGTLGGAAYTIIASTLPNMDDALTKRYTQCAICQHLGVTGLGMLPNQAFKAQR